MISFPSPLKGVGGARTGIAPANLLDVQDVNGNLYYWSDRPINAPVAITGAELAYAVPPEVPGPGEFVAWAFPTTASASAPPGGVAIVGPLSQMPVNGTVNSIVAQLGTLAYGDFVVPRLPPDAVFGHSYAIIGYSSIGTGVHNAAILFGGSAPGLGLNAPPRTQASNDLGSGGDPATFLPSLTMSETLAYTLPPIDGPEGPSSINITFVGVAIYYTLSGGQPPWAFPGEAAYGAGPYIPWLMAVPQLSFHRSLQTDIGSFVIQNVSGDSLSRDFEKIARRSTLEGAFFVYRCWQIDSEAPWIEVHGTLTVGDIGVDTVKLKGKQLTTAAEDDTPLEIYCETCQLQWGGIRCGSSQSTECQYSFQTCQVIERPMIALNDFEKNYGETVANTALNVINRRRKI